MMETENKLPEHKGKVCPVAWWIFALKTDLQTKSHFAPEIMHQISPCLKGECGFWNDKKGGCGISLAPTLINKQTVMEAVELLRKPKDFLLHAECMTCKNYDTDKCLTCPKIPINYQRKESGGDGNGT